MEYSIYINQRAAIEWELSMGESLMFAYLISSCGWMKSLPDDVEFKWASNAKLATELPLVCAHEGSVRRHMKTLEQKRLIKRRVVGNKAYFKITGKGLLWRSDTLQDPNEMVGLEGKPQRNGSGKPNESVGVDPNESVRQSNNQLSDKPISGRKTKNPSKEFIQNCLSGYHRHLPTPHHPAVLVWCEKQKRAKNLGAIWRDHPESHNDGFWNAYFQEVASMPFMVGQKPFANGDVFYANLEYTLRRDIFTDIVERALSRGAGS